MTRDEILRLAREAGIWFTPPATGVCNSSDLERFAALVAAAEREACARVCDEEADEYSNDMSVPPRNCALAIRARTT